MIWRSSSIDLEGKPDNQPLRFQRMHVDVPAGFTWPDTVPTPLRVRYQLLGSNRVDEAAALPWPNDGLGEEALRGAPPRESANVASFSFITVDQVGRRIGVRPGSWRIDRNMIIPAGYRVFAGPGTRLDLVNGAAIISRSALDLHGEEGAPVILESSDRTGQGIAVLQAGEESRLEYVECIGLSNPKQHGWELTGSVEFYESPVVIIRSKFMRNRSEDALHVMRATFSLESVTFEDTFADAFDIDFGKGSIRHSTFLNIGNDGVDASGSVVDIEDLTVRGSGDKGVSAGEVTLLTGRDVHLENAAIGIASKDRSTIRLSNVQITGGQIGVTAYRKKSEYGAAAIQIYGLALRGQELPFVVERLSSVTIDGRTIPADRENVSDILYGAVYGKASP
jgi:hypothetical protein